MRGVLLFSPLIIFILLMAFFGIRLLHDATEGKTTPFSTSAVVGTPLPEFSLPSPVEAGELLHTEDFRQGQYALINVFASWCIACQAEHPVLQAFAQKYPDIPLMGLNWRDKTEEVTAWLERFGNPYRKIGADPHGEIAIALGITGAPETYVINGKGEIVYRFAGPLTEEVIDSVIMPHIK